MIAPSTIGHLVVGQLGCEITTTKGLSDIDTTRKSGQKCALAAPVITAMSIAPWPSLPSWRSSSLPSGSEPSPDSGSPRQHKSHSRLPNYSICNKSWGVRLSSFKSKFKSLCPYQQHEEVGNYSGFEIYEAQQREAQRRKASTGTTSTACTGETLIDVDEDPAVKSGEDGFEHEQVSIDDEIKDSKLAALRSKILPTNMANKGSYRRISESSDERSSQKSTKTERKKKRRKRYLGPLGEDFELDHDGVSCGWYCSRHRCLAANGAMDWWCVAGMYM